MLLNFARPVQLEDRVVSHWGVDGDSNRADSSVGGQSPGYKSPRMEGKCWGVKRGRTMVRSCNHQCGESLNINGLLVKPCQTNLKFQPDNISKFWIKSIDPFFDEPLP